MKITIPITPRSIKYGYIYWTSDMDDTINKFIQDRGTVDVKFMGLPQGNKNVDHKYRRISLGWKQTRNIPDNAKSFILSFNREGILIVNYE